MKFNLNQLLSDQSKKSGDKERMTFKVQFIPIEKLQASGMNKYTVKDIEELRGSIELMGLQQNLLVRAKGDEFEVISGHRRLKAMQELHAAGNEQFEEVPCKVMRTTDDIQAELQLLMANSTSRELNDYEKTYQAARLQELLEELKKSGHKIVGRRREIVAELMGVSSSQIARMDSINKRLSPELKEEFKEGNVNITTAYEMSKLPEDVQKEVIEEKKAGKKITPAVAREKKEEVERGKKKQKAAESEGPKAYALQILPEMFEAVISGRKKFIYRFNDGGYQDGNILELNEWDPDEEVYTGKRIDVTVTFILKGGKHNVPPGYVIMSIERTEVAV